MIGRRVKESQSFVAWHGWERDINGKRYRFERREDDTSVRLEVVRHDPCNELTCLEHYHGPGSPGLHWTTVHEFEKERG